MTGPETPAVTQDETAEAAVPELAENALVEEVSIDGMCGVY